MSSLWDEHRRQTSPDRGPAGQAKGVKPVGLGQRAEPSPARDKGESNTGGGSVWEKFWGRENLLSALKRVEANGGAAGTDGMTVEGLCPYLKGQWLEIRASLDLGEYRPSPVRRVEIGKPGGGVRLLGKPTVVDRFIQQAVRQVMTPEWERVFSPHSYGFRPGRMRTRMSAGVRGGAGDLPLLLDHRPTGPQVTDLRRAEAGAPGDPDTGLGGGAMLENDLS